MQTNDFTDNLAVCFVLFIFFFSEHQALTNDVYLIDGNQTSPTANHIAWKYIYTSQTNYKLQCTTEPVLSSLFDFPLSDTRHQKSWLIGEFWVRNFHKTLPPGMN